MEDEIDDFLFDDYDTDEKFVESVIAPKPIFVPKSKESSQKISSMYATF